MGGLGRLGAATHILWTSVRFTFSKAPTFQTTTRFARYVYCGCRRWDFRHESITEPAAPANAGSPSRLHFSVVGPAWLRGSLGVNETSLSSHCFGHVAARLFNGRAWGRIWTANHASFQ